MHVDVWIHGKLVDDIGHSIQVMNCMCNLTQVIINILVNNVRAKTLAKLFMEQVVLSFGMVDVIVVDADRKFLSLFKEMCFRLDLIFWPLARGNNKANNVGKYHRFLNKIQTIVDEERDTHSFFIENLKTSQYA